jgi:outer membrane protein OmpA-like peptidoglycan-associated protein
VLAALLARPAMGQAQSADISERDMELKLTPQCPHPPCRALGYGDGTSVPPHENTGSTNMAAGNSTPPPPLHQQVAEPLDLAVQFTYASADLTPAGTQLLDHLSHVLQSQKLSGYSFRIEGHTDTVGTADYNRTLSEKRAATVVDYLVQTGGVERGRLRVFGLGKTQLLVSTPDQTPEPRNRRVRIINLGSLNITGAHE